MTISFRFPRGFMVRAMLIAALCPAAALAHGDSPCEQARPAGYDGFMLFSADGAYDFSSPNPDPAVTGCGATGFCDGDYFHKKIMHRSPAQMSRLAAEAKALFRTRFGIDADDPANASRILFRTYTLDPRLNYHVVSASGEHVPSEGWRVRDGGWAAIVVDPNGFELGGEMAGMHAPFASLVVFGDYNIDMNGSQGWRRSYRQPLVVHYQSLCAQEPNVLAFQCEAMSPELGSGLVRGRQEVVRASNGRSRINAVNYITFPGFSKLFP